MARSTPPSLISYTEVAYATNSSTISSASVSWLTGDVIVCIVTGEGPAAIGTPTATGLTFATNQSITAAGTCNMKVCTAVAASGSSSAVSATISTGHAGMGVWVWRGSDGVGTSTEQHTTTRTKALVPTDTHSAYCWTVGDFNAGATTSVVLTPTPTTTQESAVDAGHYTVYSGNLDDQASAGSTSFGTSGGTVTGPSSIGVQEILGTGTGSAIPPPFVMSPPRR
jgi:hypothetical protein